MTPIKGTFTGRIEGEFTSDVPPPSPPPPPPPPPPPVIQPTLLTLVTSPNPSAVGQSVTVSGRLAAMDGTGVPDKVVNLDWSHDDITYVPESQIGTFAPTDADGRFSSTMVFRAPPSYREFLRARFVGDAEFLASTSVAVEQIKTTSPPPPPPPPPSQAAMAFSWSATDVESGTRVDFLGRITDALSGAPVASGPMRVKWSGDGITFINEDRVPPLTTEADGGFAFSITFTGTTEHDEYIRPDFLGIP